MTTFVPRSRSQIRTTMLTNLQANYRSNGKDISIDKGSDAYKWYDVLALELEQAQQQAAENRKAIFVNTSSSDLIDQHGFEVSLTRKPATAARFTVIAACTVSSTVTLTGKSIKASNGVTFIPDVSSVTDGDADGFVTFAVTASRTGTTGNFSPGALLQWSSVPVNVTSATVTVSTITVVADNIESDDLFVARIYQKRGSTNGGGNNADWSSWITACTGVSEAYIFPLFYFPSGALKKILGTLTIYPLGPKQGNSVTNTRILSGPRMVELLNYIEGTRDIAGLAVANGVQLRPASLDPADYYITSPTLVPKDVEMSISLNEDYKNTVVGSHSVVASTGTTITIAGNHTDYLDQWLSVHVGLASYRGAYVTVKCSGAVFGGVNTVLTIPVQPSAPSNDAAGKVVYPGSSIDLSIREAVFGYFDSLGPSDNGHVLFQRYPKESAQNESTWYKRRCEDAVLPNLSPTGILLNGVSGVLDAQVTLPATNQTCVVGEMITLANLLLTQV